MFFKAIKTVAFCLLCGIVSAHSRAVEVVAGTGIAGFSGDNGLAFNAQFNRPQSVVAGPDGTLYIADAGNRRVRVISSAGIVTTTAGDGNAPADATWNGLSLGFPTGLVLDNSGRLWIADAQGQRVVRWTPGQGLEAISGNGQEQAAYLVGDSRLSPLLYPVGLLDSGVGVLVSEMGANRVLGLSDGQTFTLVTDKVRSPTGLANDVDGGLLFAGYGTGVVYRLQRETLEAAVTLPSPILDEDAVIAALPQPTSMAVGRDGSLYIAAPDVGIIYRLTPQGELLPFLTRPEVSRPVGLWVRSDSRLLIADEGRHQILSEPLPFPAPLSGDLDDDWAVTVTDAVLALRQIVGLDSFQRRAFLAGDVAPRREDGTTGDRRLNVEDALRILRRGVGLEPVWP